MHHQVGSRLSCEYVTTDGGRQTTRLTAVFITQAIHQLPSDDASSITHSWLVLHCTFASSISMAILRRP